MRWNERPGGGAALAVAEQALEDASVEWAEIVIDTPHTPAVVPGSPAGTVACPITGTLEHIRVTANFTPDVQMDFVTSLGGVFTGGGQFSLPIDYWPESTVTVTPNVDNSSNVLSATNVYHSAGANTVPGRITILLGFKRPS